MKHGMHRQQAQIMKNKNMRKKRMLVQQVREKSVDERELERGHERLERPKRTRQVKANKKGGATSGSGDKEISGSTGA